MSESRSSSSWAARRSPTRSQVLAEVAAVARRRPVVLVHGGGKRITEWLERLGVPIQVRGRAAGDRRPVARGGRRGPPGRGQLRARVRAARPRRRCRRAVGRRWRPAHRRADPGARARRVSVVGLRRDLLDAILVGGQVPVVAPLARDADGIVCNVNADDAAAGIAAGLGARQLVLLTDVDGVRDADGRRLDALTAGEAETLIESGVIAGGMVPKVRAALGALGWDGAEAIIADSSAPEALTRALADPTFGTRITATRAAPRVPRDRRGANGRTAPQRPQRDQRTTATTSRRSASGRSATSSRRGRSAASARSSMRSARRASRSPRRPSRATSPSSGWSRRPAPTATSTSRPNRSLGRRRDRGRGVRRAARCASSATSRSPSGAAGSSSC